MDGLRDRQLVVLGGARRLRLRPGRPCCRRSRRGDPAPAVGTRGAYRRDRGRPLPARARDDRRGSDPRSADGGRGADDLLGRPGACRLRRRRARERRRHGLSTRPGRPAPLARPESAGAERRERRLLDRRERGQLPRAGARRAPARRDKRRGGLRGQRRELPLVGAPRRPDPHGIRACTPRPPSGRRGRRSRRS